MTEEGNGTAWLASSKLSRPRHICAFFDSDDEAYNILGPFIRDGFGCGHKAVHLIGADRCDAHISRLRCEGIDIEAAQEVGQLEIHTTVDSYLREGRFDQDRMLTTFESLAQSNARGAFPLSRIVCEMDWAVEGRNVLLDLMEFEARVNEIWSRHDDIVICVYDLRKFGGETIVDVLRTHPLVIIGGILHRNPYYIPPEQFLQEVRQRRLEQGEQPEAAAARDV